MKSQSSSRKGLDGLIFNLYFFVDLALRPRVSDPIAVAVYISQTLRFLARPDTPLEESIPF